MKQLLLDENGIAEALHSLAGQVLADYPDLSKVGIVGIQQRGAYLAHRLATLFRQQGHAPHGVGELDIALYRDDVTRRSRLPVVRPSRIPFNLDECTVLLVDDVLFTGRTVRAALDELMDFGRPAAIRLLVLVDRGCRELPIQPDYAFLVHEVPADHRVYVRVHEVDRREEVSVEPPEPPQPRAQS